MNNYTIPLEAIKDAAIPSRYREVDIKNVTLSKAQLATLAGLVATPKRASGLLITGVAQSGKTSLACLVLKSLISRHKFSAHYIDLRTLVEWHFAKNPLMEKLRTCDALVIDECESHKNDGSFMALDYLYRLRLSQNLFTVIVCEEDETFEPVLAREFGPKLTARITANSVHLSMEAVNAP